MGYHDKQKESKEPTEITYSEKELKELHTYLVDNKLSHQDYLVEEGAIKIGDHGEVIVLIQVTEYIGTKIKSCLPSKYSKIMSKLNQMDRLFARVNYGQKKKIEAYSKMPEAVEKITRKKKVATS